MSFVQYYWHVLSIAFSGAWAIANIASFILPILGGYYVWRRPHWESAMKNLLWIIPLAIFVVILIISVSIVAPYQIYQDQQQQISGLKSDLIKAQNSLAASKDPNDLLRKENLAKAKQVIRNFLELVNPEILQRIDAGEMIIPIRIDDRADKRFLLLSYKYPDFNDFLILRPTNMEWPIGGKNPGFLKYFNTIIELNKNKNTSVDYYLLPKDALIGK